MPMFRKKPAEIEAWQWNGEQSGQMEGVCQCQHNRMPHVHTAHVTDFMPDGQMVFLKPGDWIIPEQCGGYYYPCKPDVFANTYDPLLPTPQESSDAN